MVKARCCGASNLLSGGVVYMNGSLACEWFWNIIYCSSGNYWSWTMQIFQWGLNTSHVLKAPIHSSHPRSQQERLWHREGEVPTDTNFPKFRFSSESSNFIIDNKHCQLFSWDWHSRFIEKTLAKRSRLNNQLVSHSSSKTGEKVAPWFCYQCFNYEKNANVWKNRLTR